MNKFIEHTGKPVALLQSNVDTDQILPKQFLTRVDKTGYADALFFDRRYLGNGEPNPEFILNQPRYRNASVLLAGKNFGGGSSREHAPWALFDYGFRVLLAESFAEIFYNNCFKSGILPVVLREKQIESLAENSAKCGDYSITADLENLIVSDNRNFQTAFSVDNFSRRLLLEGADEINMILKLETEISSYEKRRDVWLTIS